LTLAARGDSIASETRPGEINEDFTLSEAEKIDRQFDSASTCASGPSAHSGQAGGKGATGRPESETQTTPRRNWHL